MGVHYSDLSLQLLSWYLQTMLQDNYFANRRMLIVPFDLEIFSQEHLPLAGLLLPRTHDPFEVWYDTPCY